MLTVKVNIKIILIILIKWPRQQKWNIPIRYKVYLNLSHNDVIHLERHLWLWKLLKFYAEPAKQKYNISNDKIKLHNCSQVCLYIAFVINFILFEYFLFPNLYRNI